MFAESSLYPSTLLACTVKVRFIQRKKKEKKKTKNNTYENLALET